MGRPKKDRRYIYDKHDEKKAAQSYFKSCNVKLVDSAAIAAMFDVSKYTIESLK